MKVLLISTNRNVLPMPVMPVGACIIAHASERAGHTVHLLDLMFSRDAFYDIESAVNGFKPDAVGLSIRNIDNVDMQNPVFFLDDLQGMVKTIRAGTDAPIILGGAALGVMPEAILRFADVSLAVTGDGEMVFPLLLDRISCGGSCTIPGVACIENGVFHKPESVTGYFSRSVRYGIAESRIQDKNSSSAEEFSTTCLLPDYGRWLDMAAYGSRLATIPIQTKRGCSFHCVYCSYPKIEGSACRFKDPDSVAESVMRCSAAGSRDIEIVDSVFNAPLEHAMNVCASLAGVGHTARLQCLELNPLYLNDPLMTAMERAGFAGMGITVESASDPVLQGLKKGFTSREVYHAAEVVKRHRIPCAWIFMFGGPGETRETVLETLCFARNQVKSTDIVFFNTGIRIYPETELEIIARQQQGVLSCSREEMLLPRFYVSPDVDASWMNQELKKTMATQMNFINIDLLGLPLLSTIAGIGFRLGLRPPLWKHTRIIRRALRFAGMDV